MIKVFSISLDEELMKKADDMAKRQFVPTRSEFIRLALKHYLRFLKKQNGETA